MSACTSTCRATTGKRFEHCKVDGCHHTFSGGGTGDGHRVFDHTYVLAKPSTKAKPSTVQRFATEEDVPEGWSLLSVGNVVRRCLTEEEMAAKGWRIVDGVVRGPESDRKWWDKTDDEDTPEYFEAVIGNEPVPEDLIEEASPLDDLLLLDELLPVEAGEDSEGPRLDALDELLLDDLIPVAEPVQLELEYGGMELVTPGMIELPETPKHPATLDDFLADWDADTGIIRA